MLHFDNPGSINLKGALMLADPSLRDPNFTRTVLLLTEHELAQGAHGYVLNRPVGKTVGDFLPSLSALAHVPVFIGGPVSQERLTFAELGWDAERQRVVYATHLTVETALERQARGGLVRAFLGYSGWAPGQLENELKHRAWIPLRPEEEALSLQDPSGLWARLLRTLGPLYDLMSRLPEDPSLN